MINFSRRNSIVRKIDAIATQLGFRLVRRSRESDVFGLIHELSVGSSGKFVRIGDDHDGGYVLPDILEGIGLAISPGIANNWSFEIDLLERFGIPSLGIDPYIPESYPFDSIEGFVAPSTDLHSRRFSLNHILEKSNDKFPGIETQDLLLAMDVEGAEWLVLPALSPSELYRFRIICLEIHHFHQILDPNFMSHIARPFFEGLLKDFSVVNAHANTEDPSLKFGGRVLPVTLELTLLRKDWLGRWAEGVATSLSDLNRPNSPQGAECDLGKYWISDPSR